MSRFSNRQILIRYTSVIVVILSSTEYDESRPFGTMWTRIFFSMRIMTCNADIGCFLYDRQRFLYD